MPDLKFAVEFSAVDKLSDKLSSMGSGFFDLGSRAGEFGVKLGDLGESLTSFGEKLTLDSVLMQEGAEKMREWSDAITEPAFAMQRSMATMEAMTDLRGKDIDKIKEHALAYSNIHPGVTAEQWADGFTRFRGIFQDTAKAMSAEDVAGMLNRLGVDNEAATRLIQVAWSNLRVDSKTTGDQLTGAIKAFGLNPADARQYAMAVGRIASSASAAHAPLSEVFAIAGEANRQMGGGGRGAMMFASMIRGLEDPAASGKIAGDTFSRGGLVGGLARIKAEIAGMPKMEQLGRLKDMGATDPEDLLKLLDNLDEVKAKQKEIAESAGKLGAAWKTAINNVADSTALMHQNISSMFDAMASPTLPWFTSMTGKLTGVIQHATSASEKHSAITSGAIIGMSAAGTTVYAAVSGLQALGTTALFAGQGAKFLGKTWSFATDFEGNTLRLLYAKDAIVKFGGSAWNAISKVGSFGGSLLKLVSNINPVTIATKLWTGAQWLLNAAMDANPIGALIVGAAAVAVIGYEIYEHWNGVKALFKSIGDWIPGWAKKLGLAVLEGIAGPFGMIASAILGHWDSIKAACEKIGAGIRDYFVGHSPPPIGPLHELGRITIAETIAERIKPGPILAASRRTAAALAIAAPMMLGAGGPAMVGTAASGAGIVINYAPHVEVHAPAGADEIGFRKAVIDALKHDRYELLSLIESEQTRRERTRPS